MYRNFDFSPKGQVWELISTLNELKLSWIAEEIEKNIRIGRTESKSKYEDMPFQLKPQEIVRKKLKDEVFTIPYDESEQLKIGLTTVRRYFIDLFDVWEKLQNESSELLGSNCLIRFSSDYNENEYIELFQFDYRVDELKKLLEQALIELKGEE